MNGLEALKKLPKWLDDEHRDSEEKYFKASEEYKAIEKELKAFEIIKKSISDVTSLDLLLRELLLQGKINQDEFDLMKEVLE